VRAAVAGEQESADRQPTGRIRVSVDGATPAPRLFFVYRLSVGGMKRRLEFVPVVVDLEGSADGDLAETFFTALASAEPTALDPAGVVTDEAVEVAASVSRAVIAQEVTQREAEVGRINDAAIDARAESLRLSYERRRERLERQLAEARDERIITLYRGELTNRQIAFERKLAELEGKRGVEVSSELVAAGVLEVA
jgi:hypothetical protein